jgi:hypothetical protein
MEILVDHRRRGILGPDGIDHDGRRDRSHGADLTFLPALYALAFRVQIPTGQRANG